MVHDRNRGIADLPPELEGAVELRSFCRAMAWAGAPATMSEPAARPMWDGPVVGGSGAPLSVGKYSGEPVVWVDGCQGQVVATWMPGAAGGPMRPVMLLWAGAGAAVIPRELLWVEERLWIACSQEDVAWAEALPGGVPVVATPELYPVGIRRDGLRGLREVRAELERRVVAARVHKAAAALLVIDGSLLGHRPLDNAVGVVKSCKTRYLSDERPLAGLPPGSRTATLELPPRSADEAPRWTCYVRLHPPVGDDWTHGLVRLEAWKHDDLDRGAAAAYAHRQLPRSGDPRWDRHLSGIRLAEEILKHRRPAVFTL